MTTQRLNIIPIGNIHPIAQGNIMQHWPNGHTVIAEGLVMRLLSRNLNKNTLSFAVVGVVKPEKKEGT